MVEPPQRSRVERCALCGAPLPDVAAYVMTCVYCQQENRLVSKEAEEAQLQAEAVTRAAGEAQAMARKLGERRQELEAAFTAAMIDLVTDRSESNGAVALHAYEAMLRIVQAPSVHIAQAMGPKNGAVVLQQLDEAIEEALKGFAVDNAIARA